MDSVSNRRAYCNPLELSEIPSSSALSTSSLSSLFRSKENVASIPPSVHPTSTALRTLAAQLLLRGATISPVLNEKVTHLVVDFENNYSEEKERALQVNQNLMP